MRVPRDQYQIMFQRERGDPQVIGGNWRARALELDEYTRVMVRRFPAWKQYSNSRLGEELTKESLVPMLLSSSQEPRLDFCENHQRNPNLIASPQPIRERGVTLEEIGEPVGI